MKENDDDDDLNVRDEEDCVTSKHVRSFSVFYQSGFEVVGSSVT